MNTLMLNKNNIKSDVIGNVKMTHYHISIKFNHCVGGYKSV